MSELAKWQRWWNATNETRETKKRERNELGRMGERESEETRVQRRFITTRFRTRVKCERNANNVQISIVENWFQNHLQCKLTFQLSIATLRARATDRISKRQEIYFSLCYASKRFHCNLEAPVTWHHSHSACQTLTALHSRTSAGNNVWASVRVLLINETN